MHFSHHRIPNCTMKNLVNFLLKERDGSGREKQSETITPDYERGGCDSGDMPCGHGNAADNIGNTMNKRLMVFVAIRRFFVRKMAMIKQTIK